jgi:hypothetical protein
VAKLDTALQQQYPTEKRGTRRQNVHRLATKMNNITYHYPSWVCLQVLLFFVAIEKKFMVKNSNILKRFEGENSLDRLKIAVLILMRLL